MPAGLVVAPGVVDLHTHSDVSNLSDPGAISAIDQGVTTQVVGLCGFSAAPGHRRRSATHGRRGAGVRVPRRRLGLAHDRRVPGGGRARVGTATNTVTLVGHTTLRRFAMGGEPRGPTRDGAAADAGPAPRGDPRGRARLLDGPVVRARDVRDDRRADGAHQVAAAAGRPYHTHMRYGESTRPADARGGDRDGRASRRRAQHLAPLPAPDRTRPTRPTGYIER